MARETPSVDSNALAAPASGFGQTVSFAFNPNGQPPQLQRQVGGGPRQNNPGAVRAVQADGSQAVRAADQAAANAERIDPTGKFLMRVADDLMKKNLEEEKNRQFISGMQRAMSGEATKEIKEGQPWFARIFGDTPEVEGARAYEAQATVNKTITQATADMDKLKRMNAQEAGNYFTNLINGVQTGDASTDIVISKGMIEQMPALMKAQAKAHHAWKQDTAVKAMTGALTTGAQNLQQMGELHSNDEIDDAAMTVAGQAFVRSMLPPEGMNEDTWTKMVTTQMRSFADKGQFHPIKALKDAGIYQALSPEQQLAIDKSIEVNATKYRDKYAFTFATELGAIKSDAANPPAGQTPKQLSERIDQFNAKFQKATGSPVGIFTSDQKADMLAGNFNAYKAEEKRMAARQQVLDDRNATASAKAQAAEDKERTIMTLVSTGDWGAAKLLPGVSGDDVELAVEAMALKNPEATVRFLAEGYLKGSGNLSKRMADRYQADIKSADVEFRRGNNQAPDGFFKSVNVYRALEAQGGSLFADSYFGDYAKQVAWASRRLGDNVLQNPDAPVIYNQVMSVGGMRPEKLDAKEQKALVKTIASEGSSWWPAMFGGDSLTPETINRVSTLIEDDVGMWKAAGFSDKIAVQKAINDNLGPQAEGGRRGGAKGEILGGHFIQRQPGTQSARLFDIMATGQDAVNVPEEKRGVFFNDFLKDRLKGRSGELQFFRQPGATGDVFNAIGMDKDGASIILRFTSDDLKQFAKDATERYRQNNVRFDGTGRNADEVKIDIKRWQMSQQEKAEASAELARKRAIMLKDYSGGYGPALALQPNLDAPTIYSSAAQRAAVNARQGNN